jgi:hypothetical protein
MKKSFRHTNIVTEPNSNVIKNESILCKNKMTESKSNVINMDPIYTIALYTWHFFSVQYLWHNLMSAIMA